MIHFESDYTQGAVPEIIQRLTETNMEMTVGYGEDEYCLSARKKICKEIGKENADVHFLVGGTQTNLIFISSALRPHQGVLCAETGHIYAHETGAIESCGHKVLTLPSADGKITAHQVKSAVESHRNDPTMEHTVQPKLVYISFPTENGTIYSKKELTDLYSLCREMNLILYIDGARLGYGLTCSENDLTIKDIASLCDAFYIGGTKVGALFGEALVILNDSLKADFRYIIKQKGAMFAKGRLLGLQFDTLFTDSLYYRASKNATDLAGKLSAAFKNKGIEMYYDSPTNQVFPILTNEQQKKLSEKFVFCFWANAGDRTAVRFCTSWATKESDVDELVCAIKQL